MVGLDASSCQRPEQQILWTHKDALKELAFKMTSKNGVEHPFKNNKALSFLTPAPASIRRCSAFNKRQVDHFLQLDNL